MGGGSMVVSVGAHIGSGPALDAYLAALRAVTDRFDQGRLDEAGELAVCLRTLLHHGSAARVARLALPQRLTWVDTAGVLNPKNPSASSCLTLMKIRTGLLCRGEYVPKFGLYPPAPIRTRSGEHIDRGSRIPFDHWWTNPVARDAAGAEFSRRHLVLAVARPGFPAPDPEMDAAFQAIAASESLGWVLSGEKVAATTPLECSPVIASVRQIGYEVVQSIREQRELIDGSLVA